MDGLFADRWKCQVKKVLRSAVCTNGDFSFCKEVEVFEECGEKARDFNRSYY